jgi:hypothetical protein
VGKTARCSRKTWWILALLGLAASDPSSAKNLWSYHERGVLLEVIGQLYNPPAPAATQYGYLSNLAGVDTADLFAGSPHNPGNARLTFFNDMTTQRAIVNGPITVVNRRGTMAIYLDEEPNGDWADPETFRDGTPVFVAEIEHQVIVVGGLMTGTFTATFTGKVLGVAKFDIGSGPEPVQIGSSGQEFKLFVSGMPNTNHPGLGTPGHHVIAGYAVR